MLLPLFTLFVSTLILSAASVLPASAAGQYQYNPPPGMPGNAVQVDKTDVTPYQLREQMMAGNTYVFAYRNMTMMMNCSRNSEMEITISNQVRTRTLAMNMIQNQSALFTMNIATTPPAGVATMQRTLNCYWGIEPNATLQLQVQLRMHINTASLNAELNRVVNASRLTWMYWNTSRNCWVAVKSYMDGNGYLVCDANHLSTWTVAEGVPGMPANAYNYDRSDITPNKQIEQIMAGNTYVFAYRYMTMMMNCSRNTVMNLTVSDQVRARTFAMNLVQNQEAQLDMNIATTPPTGIQTMTRTLNFYWGIAPNATLQIRAQLRVHIDGAALKTELGRDVDKSKLTWMYWNTNRNSWETVNSWMDQDGYLVCETTHFSTWTVAEVDPATPWLTYAMIGGAIAAIAIVAIYLVKRR